VIEMLRVFSDFNTRTEDGFNLVLQYEEKDLADQLESLHLSEGDKIILYQDGDFEVTATLAFKYEKFLKKNILVGIPDWSTLVHLDEPPPIRDDAQS
jgi:hypothetical protein